jgi:hypothetical protein
MSEENEEKKEKNVKEKVFGMFHLYIICVPFCRTRSYNLASNHHNFLDMATNDNPYAKHHYTLHTYNFNSRGTQWTKINN